MKFGLVVLVCATVAVLLFLGHRLVAADPSIAFVGDSITQGWSYPSANFGIHGETTGQMLSREPAILSEHRYRILVLLGGTNDTLLHIHSDQTIRNLEELGEAAVQQDAQPVLCEIPPIFHSFNPQDTTDYMPKVVELNRKIAALAAAHHWPVVDYYSPLLHHPAYLSDGVHMKRRGYVLMELALLHRLY